MYLRAKPDIFVAWARSIGTDGGSDLWRMSQYRPSLEAGEELVWEDEGEMVLGVGRCRSVLRPSRLVPVYSIQVEVGVRVMSFLRHFSAAELERISGMECPLEDYWSLPVDSDEHEHWRVCRLCMRQEDRAYRKWARRQARVRKAASKVRAELAERFRRPREKSK